MKKGFTLIELLVVIAIIASIVALAVPNYLSARERARDTKRKSEMQQLKAALRLYYNDFSTYPTSVNAGVGKINYIQGCGPGGTAACPCLASADFASGDSCEEVYMKKFPSDLGSSLYYYRTTSGDDFCLRAVLDNKSDGDSAISQARCVSACGSNCSGSGRYCVCAD